MPDRSLCCQEIPTTARVTLTRNERHTLLHVKATYPEARGLANVIESHNFLPAGCRVSVQGSYRTAYTVPDRQPVSLTQEGDRTSLTLPEIRGYVCVALEK